MKDVFKQAYIAKLSGIVKYHNDKEIWWEDENESFTLEFVNDSAVTVIKRLYRENKLYCIIYYKNCKPHRIDGPAVEYANRYRAWYQNGKLHRLDSPAAEWANGDKWWYQNGKRTK